jgi:hypothetical protein
VWALSDGRDYVIELPVLGASESFVMRSDQQGNGWVLISPGHLSLEAVAACNRTGGLQAGPCCKTSEELGVAAIPEPE